MLVRAKDREFRVVDGQDGFWVQVNVGTWEPETFTVLASMLRMDKSYVDIGAWIGPTCLYGGQIAKRCYAIEPDPVAFEMLEKNVVLNGFSNILLDNIGIFDKEGEIIMASPNTSLGDSCTSYLFTNSNTITAKTTTLQKFFETHQIDDCNFIKMDVEGAEYIILPHAKDFLKDLDHSMLLALHSPHFTVNKNDYFDAIIYSLTGVYRKVFLVPGFQEIDVNHIRNCEGWDNVLLTK